MMKVFDVELLSFAARKTLIAPSSLKDRFRLNSATSRKEMWPNVLDVVKFVSNLSNPLPIVVVEVCREVICSPVLARIVRDRVLA